ncbi:transcriptional regulator [Actinomycetota bacterium]|nr:transcriptional regulator [Actinomycetota bacterium]
MYDNRRGNRHHGFDGFSHRGGFDHLGRGGFRFDGSMDEQIDAMVSRSFKAKHGQIQSIVLEILLDGDMHGYEIITTIEERTGGLWKPSAGSVYPTLTMLTEQGLLSVEEEGSKKTYSLTDEGRSQAEKAVKKNRSFWKRTEQMSKKNIKQKMELMQIVQLIGQIGHTGDKAKQTRLYEVLNGLQGTLEDILYGEDDENEGGE